MTAADAHPLMPNLSKQGAGGQSPLLGRLLINVHHSSLPHSSQE